MIKRYALRDCNGFVWWFDSWQGVQDWVNGHSDDSPFEYCDHSLDDVVPENSFWSF